MPRGFLGLPGARQTCATGGADMARPRPQAKRVPDANHDINTFAMCVAAQVPVHLLIVEVARVGQGQICGGPKGSLEVAGLVRGSWDVDRQTPVQSG